MNLTDYDRPDTLPPGQLTVHLPLRTHRPVRVGWFVLGSGPSPTAVLAAVEGSLSVQEVALSRWRAWARQNACWVRSLIPHVHIQSLEYNIHVIEHTCQPCWRRWRAACRVRGWRCRGWRAWPPQRLLGAHHQHHHAHFYLHCILPVRSFCLSAAPACPRLWQRSSPPCLPHAFLHQSGHRRGMA